MLLYFYVVLLFVLSGDLVTQATTTTTTAKRHKRWVDVDEQDAWTKDLGRQKTPTAPDSGERSDLNNLGSYAKDLDKGISDTYQSINDISNLQSVENEPQQVMGGGSIVGENAGITDPTSVEGVGSPAMAFDPSQATGGVRGDPGVGFGPSSENYMTSELPQTMPSFMKQTGEEMAAPFTVLGRGDGCVGNNCDVGHVISDYPPPPHVDAPSSDVTSVSTANQAFHTLSEDGEIMVPQGHIYNQGPPVHRVEPAIHRTQPGPVIQKFVPGKTIFMRPFHVFRTNPRHLFRHYHRRHHPRLFLVHRTHHPRLIHVCEKTDCKNGGACVIVNDQVKCLCNKGYKGHHCEDVSKCYPDPCSNGGKCYESDSGFTCTCSMSFYGERCEARSYCHPNPCRNGYCYEKPHGYECSCETGYKGFNCGAPSFCHPNPCLNGGICSEDDVTYKCSCAKGFYGNDCDFKRQVCQINTCQNGGVCIQDIDTVHCTCVDGFRGKTCEDKQFRPCGPSVCLFGGSCIATTQFDYKCMCPPGRTGRRCANMIEEPCANCHQHALCVGQTCRCRPGYTGSGYYCERAPSKCHPNPCENGGTCTDRYYYMDIVSDGGVEPAYDIPHRFTPTVNHESEEAAIITQDEHGDVVNLPTDLHANDLIKEKHEVNVADHNMIDLSKIITKKDIIQTHNYNNTFKKNKIARAFKRTPHGRTRLKREDYETLPDGVDRNLLNIYGFYCSCLTGYKGLKCEKTEPCSPNPCLHDGVCEEKDGMPTCICKFPHVGVTCNGTNACEPNPCRNSGKCTDTNGEASCKCQPRFEGDKCEVNKCDKCHMNADCTLRGKCVCKAGFRGDGIHSCEKNSYADPCNPNPCKNGGTCLLLDDGGSFQCVCPFGYGGDLCDKHAAPVLTTTVTPATTVVVTPTPEKSYSQCHPNPCLNDGQCMKVGDGYDCVCTPQFKGRHCEVDKCMECDIQADCNQGKCACKDGYHGDGYSCAKDKLCEEDCPVHSRCDGDQCVCFQGYTWTDGQCVHTTDMPVTHTLQSMVQRHPQNMLHSEKVVAVHEHQHEHLNPNPHPHPTSQVHHIAFHIPPPISPPKPPVFVAPPVSFSPAVSVFEPPPLPLVVPPPPPPPVYIPPPPPPPPPPIVAYAPAVPAEQPVYIQPTVAQPIEYVQQPSTEQAMYHVVAEPAVTHIELPAPQQPDVYQQQPSIQSAYSGQNMQQYSPQQTQYPSTLNTQTTPPPTPSPIRSPQQYSSLMESEQKAKELQALGVPDNVAQQLVQSVNKQQNPALKEDIIISVYQNLGCWKDSPSWWDASLHAIPSVEGKYSRLIGSYTSRKDAIGQCADTAKELGYKVFAVQKGGECFTSPTAHLLYSKYGRANDCDGGTGARSSSDVYSLVNN